MSQSKQGRNPGVSDSAVVFDVTRLPKDSAEESMVGDTAWVPVTDPKDLPSNVFNGLQIRDTLPNAGRVSDPSNSSLPFLEQEMEVKVEEPVEVIVSRVVYALLISASLVINLLLVIAIMRLKARVAVIYLLTAAMVIPDCIFYTKVRTENQLKITLSTITGDRRADELGPGSAELGRGRLVLRGLAVRCPPPPSPLLLPPRGHRLPRLRRSLPRHPRPL